MEDRFRNTKTEEEFIKALSQEEVEDLAELITHPGYKILQVWQEREIEKLKEQALDVQRQYFEVMIGNQKQVIERSRDEQLDEFKGRAIAIRNERVFVKKAADRVSKKLVKKK